MIQLWSDDNAALVVARTILKQEPRISLQIFLGGTVPEGAFVISDIWEKAIVAAATKYKRLGIAIDRSKDTEKNFLQETGKNLISIQYELLSEFSNRGMADTVEFRRLTRKYLRSARNAHCDGILFLSGVLAEEKTRKVISQIMGTQSTPIFVTEFLPDEFFIATEKQSIEIFTDQDIERIHTEAEHFLHIKLAKGVVISRNKK